MAGSRLAALFAGQPVIVEEARLAEDLPPPLPEEARLVDKAVARRKAEFAAGRACARRALERLGVVGFALLNGEDRAPLWPPGIVGAITHTGPLPGGFCGVAVARAAEVRAVGLDAEEARPLEERLWSYVLTASERRALAPADPAAQGRLAKVVFSAKECFYKAQYPLTRQYLRFDQVEIALDLAAGAFEAIPLAGAAGPGVPARSMGRFSMDETLVLTGLVLPL
jgi:4'-phosphopantetheinyl transferase EntD